MPRGTVTALLEHKFDVSNIEALDEIEYLHGPVTSVIHNGVNLTFQLQFVAKDFSEKRRKGHAGLYIEYLHGPAAALTMGFEILAARGPQRAPYSIIDHEERDFCSDAWGSVVSLPNSLKKLRAAGYVGDDSMLHVFAVLLIPESAFEDPFNKSPASSAQNPFFQHLFSEIKTPTATNSVISNRIELISNDDRHFWVHKDVLAFNSRAFKQMLDPNKPEGARFKYLREGQLTLENVSGGAMREMLSFVYLKHTTTDFDQFALELIPVAEMYELDGLGTLCNRTLIVHTANEKDIVQLLRILAVSRLHKLIELEKVCVKSLNEVVQEQNDNLKFVCEEQMKSLHSFGVVFYCLLAHEQLKPVCKQLLKQHIKECKNLTVPIIVQFASEAKRYILNDLLVSCGHSLLGGK